MTNSILAELGVNAATVFALGKSDARSAINLLLRWEAWEDAMAVLDQFGDDGLVTTMDARARALIGLGRPVEAIALLEQRLEKRESTQAQVHLARALIAAGENERAAALLQPMTTGDSTVWWAFAPLAEAYLAQGQVARAEQFAHDYRELSPNSRHPDLIQAQTALLRGDRIGASAFASRAAADGELELTADQLRTLRLLFASIPDEIRLADTEQQLAALRAADVAALRAMLETIIDTAGDKTIDTAPARKGKGKDKGKGVTAGPAAGPAAPDRPAVTELEAVPLSEAELAHLQDAARRLFGFDNLLPWQPQIMAAALRNEDVLAILPTGGGKSLTYQLPALLAAEESAAALGSAAGGSTALGSTALGAAMGGSTAPPLTLVISPLIALMEDQVQGLPDTLRRQAIALNSALDGNQLSQALHAIAGGHYALVYAAPERLRQRAFVQLLRRRGVARLVIDEAHCVSSWGHNFRPDYLHIAQAHRDMGAPPILALTATAPTRVRQDIEMQLFANVRVRATAGPSREAVGGTRRFRLIAGDSFRPNLKLAAEQLANSDERRARTLELCAALPGPGIVYARSRQDCEEIAAALRHAGLNAQYYHAGLPTGERSRIQADFLDNRIDLLVATVAFGMGVDKPDIRLIIHHGMPSSLEAYYQEAGRAGRDGRPSTCVLLFTAGERSSMKTLRRRDALTIDLLRQVYSQARRLMGQRAQGSFDLAALAQATTGSGGESDTRVRVALSALEEAGQLRHHYDVPDQLNIRLGSGGDEAYRAFLDASGLEPGAWQTVPFADFVRSAGLDVATAEAQLEGWRGHRFLDFSVSGRRTLLTLADPPPADGRERVQQIVERFAALQEQQVEEIYAYARTRRCRHGHLSTALGGVERKKCASCDNCGGVVLPATQLVAPDAAEVEDQILLAVGRRSIGRVRLARLLRGDGEATDSDKRSPQFGTLRLVSESKLLDAMEAMVAARLLVLEEFESGGVVVKVGPSAARRQKDLDSRW